MNIGFAVLDCHETNIENERSGFSYLKEYFMTRNDNFEGVEDEEWLEQIGGSHVQMYYSSLAIETGAEFSWQVENFYLDEMEQAFFDLLMWQFKNHGLAGGLSRAGYGRILVEYKDYEPQPEKALAWLEANKDMVKTVIESI